MTAFLIFRDDRLIAQCPTEAEAIATCARVGDLIVRRSDGRPVLVRTDDGFVEIPPSVATSPRLAAVEEDS